MRTGTFVRVAVVALAMTLAASMAPAQVLNSGAQPIALNATLAESLTLSLSANAVNFTLSAGSAVNAGSTNITATTKWVLQPGRPTVASTGPNGAPVAAGTRGGDKP